MSIIYNDTAVENVVFNNQEVKKIVYNSRIIWCKNFELSIIKGPGVGAVLVSRTYTEAPEGKLDWVKAGKTIYYRDKLSIFAAAQTNYALNAYCQDYVVDNNLTINMTATLIPIKDLTTKIKSVFCQSYSNGTVAAASCSISKPANVKIVNIFVAKTSFNASYGCLDINYTLYVNNSNFIGNVTHTNVESTNDLPGDIPVEACTLDFKNINLGSGNGTSYLSIIITYDDLDRTHPTQSW